MSLAIISTDSKGLHQILGLNCQKPAKTGLTNPLKPQYIVSDARLDTT
jgi:hypothetical protein